MIGVDGVRDGPTPNDVSNGVVAKQSFIEQVRGLDVFPDTIEIWHLIVYGIILIHALIGFAAGIASMLLARVLKGSDKFNYIHVDLIQNRGMGAGFPILLLPVVIPSCIILTISYFLGFAFCLPLCFKLSLKPLKLFFNRKKPVIST
jgi:hypothetical protein